MWLAHDHYKWRLMRAVGIDENLITGTASWKDKFFAIALAVSQVSGNPLHHWSKMELVKYFGIDTPLCENTAEIIWNRANSIIKEKQLSPRKLISQSGVSYIATTDDIADSLEYHKKLRLDNSFNTAIAPTFRPDKLLLINGADYRDYIKTLSENEINSLADLKAAVSKRLDFFCENGCRFADIGIQYFPDFSGDEQSAENAFLSALNGQPVTDTDYFAFLREMYIFIGGLCKSRGVILQLHLAVLRNVNTPLYLSNGADCGGDCIGDVISGSKIAALLNSMHTENALPKTILYTLNPAMTAQLASVAGSFPNVRIGTAWWFNDHKRGITEVIKTVAEIGHLGSFLGMLTDSRSFLSYARHDYFRRILADI